MLEVRPRLCILLALATVRPCDGSCSHQPAKISRFRGALLEWYIPPSSMWGHDLAAHFLARSLVYSFRIRRAPDLDRKYLSPCVPYFLGYGWVRTRDLASKPIDGLCSNYRANVSANGEVEDAVVGHVLKKASNVASISVKGAINLAHANGSSYRDVALRTTTVAAQTKKQGNHSNSHISRTVIILDRRGIYMLCGAGCPVSKRH
jgi:hypothetical protein